jgi:uncharacterized protein YbjT (DUF2867 family)
MKKILVVGGTGVLGRAVVRRLLAIGTTVRVLTRRPERAADLAEFGAEVVGGDLVDARSLERACAGVDRVLAAAHSLLGRGRYRSERVDDAGHRALIDSAREAGAERFVYTSGANVSGDHPVDFFRTKAAVEEHLRQSGIPHVILRPTAFMEQHVHDFNGKNVLAKGRAQLIGSGQKKRNFVAADDVAQFAVLALLTEPIPPPLIEVGGPGNFTNREVAELYASLAGIPARISHVPAAVARAIGKLASPWHPGLGRLLNMLALPDDAFPETFDDASLCAAYPNITRTTLEAFVRGRVLATRSASSP